ncbi:unnamed protein product [Macrosiphum euphorbiae]|uniref:6-phosphogluconate dehydrogenase, decarboxylating n=1 Tax=Macrosiphum euphorbiae TaxID=13131 RepID=A0AAV0YBC2_9HEMI|nr:unnamed protein product [Macrosiphum euphorbiae]
MKDQTNSFELDSNLKNLLLDPFFKEAVHNSKVAWRKVVTSSAMLGIPSPPFSTVHAFYDSYRSARLPANLLPAQRDYFGSHTYELLTAPGKYIHTNWTGTAGDVSASTYKA